MQSTHTAQPAEPSIAELKQQLATVRGDVKILAGMAKDAAAGQARQVRDDAKDQVHQLSEEAQKLLHDAKAEGERLVGDAEEYAKRNPLTTALGAFAIGWLVGSALRR